jgi:hypothetical protein
MRPVDITGRITYVNIIGRYRYAPLHGLGIKGNDAEDGIDIPAC